MQAKNSYNFYRFLDAFYDLHIYFRVTFLTDHDFYGKNWYI